MSTLLPVQPAPARAGAASPPAPERRADGPRSDFATSLASARSDARATSAAAPSRDTDVDAATARQTAQQRSQAQLLMLRGAMRFAATRGDASATPTPTELALSRPDAAVSLPDAPPADGESVVDPSPDAMLMLLPLPRAPRADETGPLTSDPPTTATLPHDAIVVSLPEFAPPVDAAEHGTAAQADDSAAPAATIAAFQLVAALPMLLQPIAVPEQDALPETLPSWVAATGSTWTIGEPNRRALAAAAALLEDHFDAPASQISDGAASPATTAPSAASGTPTPATDAATSDETTRPAPPTDVAASAVRGTPIALAPAHEAAMNDDATLPAVPIGATVSAASAAAASSTPTAPTAAADAAPSRDASDPTDAAAALRRRGGATTVQTDIAALDPAFRDKLEKVMERMRAEFGHTVTVVETARSQSRQEQLYAQGRTAPGPVVTWTKQSRHTRGMAADLMVDGAWENPEGYAHLATVAREEGLRTLGARDPGHVEMSGDGSVSGETLESLLADLQGGSGDEARTARGSVQRDADARADRMAQVANVAQVARVATVAQVARVADVARPGTGPRESSSHGGESSSPLAVSAPAPLLTGSDVGNAIRTATPVGAVNMADRISQLMDLQATQAARPLNSVLLRMQDDGGVEDQIRIDARGTTVGARLGIGDAQQAAALTDSVSELRAALERRGLSTDGVRVQAVRQTDSATFARATAPMLELAATRAASDAQAQGGSRDQTGRDQQQREALAREQARHPQRPSSDDPRHRSRREQPETRQ